ncbi:zinc-dependent alcohol dehydrogenase [Rhizohabitans arisaemae]|uniref:zinc-dependent alcohol dehydrogenase n=1 Tax=Rhizohabitans arisaemae TaxID=2720610 RepID=UPI0024B1A2F3|nr:alcohol dehydrogenase catalytic domain-containing protein [Rhizohabitans arisaemae]
MRALAKLDVGPGQVGLVERPTPSPGPGQVLVEVHGTGVCGTDLHIQAGEYPAEPPVTMGHEVTGLVVDIGPGADPAWRGRRVVTETYYSTCGICDRCRDGRPNLCAARRSIGSHADGGFAPLLVLPERNLHAVPEKVGTHAAALAEPLACVCNCLLDPPVVQPGDRVVVTGPGAVGLLAAQVARAQGGSVLVCGLPQDSERLAVAERLGFAVTDGMPEEGTADVVVECSGSAGGAALCLRTVRRGGRFVQVGVFGGAVTVPLNHLVYGELVITSGFASTPASWRHAMRLIASESVDLESLLTGVAPLSAWQDVFADLRAGRGLKIVIDPRL